MQLKISNFILFFLGIIILIPHFPSLSYAAARGLDFVYLGTLILLIIILTLGKKITILPKLFVGIILLMVYLCSIIIGSLNGFLLGFSDISSFTDLYRPLLWSSSLILGIGLASIVKEERMLSFFKVIAIISLFVAILQKIGVDFFYDLYSGPGHIISNRATGICQDFADYSFLQVFGATLFFIDFNKNNQIKSLLWGFLLCFSVILSTSKAGLGLMAGMILVMTIQLFFSKKTSNAFRWLIVSFFILILGIGYLYIMSNESFFRELTLLLAYDSEALPSISERQIDFEFVKSMIWEYISLDSFIGFGSSSLLSGTYIEVAWLSIIFRTGFVGFFFYYAFFLFLIINLYKNKEYRYLGIFLLFSVGIDFAAAMTNRILGVSLFLILSGYLLVKSNKENTKI